FEPVLLSGPREERRLSRGAAPQRSAASGSPTGPLLPTRICNTVRRRMIKNRRVTERRRPADIGVAPNGGVRLKGNSGRRQSPIARASGEDEMAEALQSTSQAGAGTGQLRRNALGVAAITFFVVSAAAPLTAVAGGYPIAMLLGNG